MASRCGSRERRRAIPRKEPQRTRPLVPRCEVVTAEPGRSFAFRTVPERLDPTRVDSTTWSYVLEPEGTSTACHACVPDHQAADTSVAVALCTNAAAASRHASPDDAHTGRAESRARGTGLLGREALAAAHSFARPQWLSRRRSRARRDGRRPRPARSRATSGRCSGTSRGSRWCAPRGARRSWA